MPWIVFTDDDDKGDSVIILPVADVICISQRIGGKDARITSQGNDGVTETYDTKAISLHYSLDAALQAMVKLCHPEPPPGAPVTLSPCGECILQDGEVCDVCGATNAALPCVEIEPETSYARALRTKTCPHCQGNIEANIWDCPECGKSLAQHPEKRKPGDEWTTEGGRLLRYVPWNDQLGKTLAVLDVAAEKIIATRDASCQPFDWPAPGKPTIGVDDREKLPGDDGECETCGRNHFAGDCSG